MQGGDSDIFSAKRQKWHLFFVYFHDKKGKKMADSPIVTICRCGDLVFIPPCNPWQCYFLPRRACVS